MKKYRLELSLALGLGAMLLVCAEPHLTLSWWGAAFAPLCDGVLTLPDDGEAIVLRTRLWELLRRLCAAR